MVKLSIIVPVYNVEDYVYDCIKSLLNQTIGDFEIIVIDDGSTDNSINIIEKIKDDRIKIIRKKNGGLSSARNLGIKYSTGEYLAFVDSDDYIGLDKAYEEMYNIAVNDNSDIVSGGSIWYFSEEKKYNHGKTKEIFECTPMKSEEFFLRCLKFNLVYAPVWVNIYKRRLFIDNNLYFKEGIYHEDEEFTPRAILNSKNISIYYKNFYIYRQREGSITKSKLDIKKGRDVFNICLDLEKYCSTIKDYNLKKAFKNYLANISLEQIYKYKFVKVNKDIKKFILRNSTTIGSKIKSYLLNMNVYIYILFEKLRRKYLSINCIR